jgi:spermidine synthase
MRAPPITPSTAVWTPPDWRLPLVALFLLVSGACSLVYQMAWLREFRLIFGGATPAAAAVLAVFMGGLGAGAAWFGRVAERSPDVLRLYARLELGAAVAVAMTPWLLDLVRAVYLWTGGVLVWGTWGATLAQLILAVVVMGGPCFLLGGNLPPATKWVETDADRGRGSLGILYGSQALGALLGVVWATFWALEHLGTRGTLWWMTGLNLVLGGVAWWVSGRVDPVGSDRGQGVAGGSPSAASVSVTHAGREGDVPAGWVYGAAALTGFTFFLGELVWFRLLTPLLGGSVYCLGLILAVVLLGIGVGGGLYRWALAGRMDRINLGSLAWLAVVQAVLLALPWALGDRLAVLSFHLQQWRSLGWGGLVSGWTVVVGMMVLGPSILAGMQFPLLVALLGEGRRNAARQVGWAYAANTGGAIAGSILGGFVLIPWLTAPGCWRLVVGLTLGLAFVALVLWERPWRPSVVAGVLVGGVLAVGMAFHATGPTAAWRHSAIGYGIMETLPSTPGEMEEFLRENRRLLAREYEGREASLGVVLGNQGHALFVNGKADGSALPDAGTQIMLGLIGALQHPDPRRSLVIGLGTGSSAGWLADVPGMERVDVVELEPRVADVARDFFRPVNRDVLAKTNLNLIIGDAREVLMVSRDPYDLIVSEPSNPYRAGVATLFTREYYQAAERRLSEGGIFTQWLQGYQLSVEDLQVVYATLLSVFPQVETWMTQSSDLVFVCRREEPDYSREQLETRLGQSYWAEAMGRAWRSSGVEGFLGRYMAGTALARRAAAGARAVNTDSRNTLEYGMARAQLGAANFHYEHLLTASLESGDDAPPHLAAGLDRGRLTEERLYLLGDNRPLREAPPGLAEADENRAKSIVSWTRGEHLDVLRFWRGTPVTPAQQLMLAMSAARAGTAEQAQPWIDRVAANWPAEAAIASAWVAHRAGPGAEPSAVEEIRRALAIMEQHPWVQDSALLALVEVTRVAVREQPDQAGLLLEAWGRPLSVGLLSRSAVGIWHRLSVLLPAEIRLQVVSGMGPHFPWTREFLEYRRDTLEELKHPMAPVARRDWETFLQQEGALFLEVLEAGPRSLEVREATVTPVEAGAEGEGR